MVKTIAIGQGGGPTPVINSTLLGFINIARKHKARVLGLRNGVEALLNPHNNIFDITNWPNHIDKISGALLGTTRTNLRIGRDDKKIDLAKQTIKKYNIDGGCLIGGQDTADTAEKIGFVHAAKTIDNDLMHSHHTPGFGSAALFNTLAVRHLDSDLGSFIKRQYSHNSLLRSYEISPVIIYQVMGRDTGWLAQATIFASLDKGLRKDDHAPHIIWPAELPFNEDRFLGALEDRLTHSGNAFVVISEGVFKNIEGKKVELAKLTGELRQDGFGHFEFGRGTGSAAQYISSLISEKLVIYNVKTIKDTVILPQHLQRCFIYSDIDLQEARRVGKEAFKAIYNGNYGISIVLQKDSNGNIRPKTVDISEIAGKIRKVDETYWDGGIHGPNNKFIQEFHPCLGKYSLPEHPSSLPLIQAH